ncbi:MAG: class I SAM-dependent methyltransferase [Acidobacteriia bacterium]|nr:class I SAM-dependent methyltransferase [Terriglobia bacterium]
MRSTSHQPPATDRRRPKSAPREGWHGWDEYAPFYDWENAQTLGRRDVPFWRRVAMQAGGPVLELGCGTGRVSRPLAEAGVDLVGIDRSAPMLARALARRRTAGAKAGRAPTTARFGGASLRLVRGDIRALPFRSRAFSMVLAPYGILQSLTRPRDLAATLASVARVMKPGATFGIDLVPDVPQWREYKNKVQLAGPGNGAHLTLIESVRQDPARRLTTFTQRYVERRGGRTREHCFDLTFRTLSVPQMTRALERAGFEVQAALGDYQGRPWDARADVWIILARRTQG